MIKLKMSYSLVKWTLTRDRGDWNEVLDKNVKILKRIEKQIKKDIQRGITIAPKLKDVYRALEYTPLCNIKIVLLGMDPYINRCKSYQCYSANRVGELQACGLAFSVRPGIKAPPSLVNIFKELKNEGYKVPSNENGCLRKWAKRGVLLLNTSLTVQLNKSNSHSFIGWDIIVNAILSKISLQNRKIAWILLGNNAKKYKQIITHPLHRIFESGLPSPLNKTVPFLGTGIFRKAEDYVGKNFTWNL